MQLHFPLRSSTLLAVYLRVFGPCGSQFNLKGFFLSRGFLVFFSLDAHDLQLFPFIFFLFSYVVACSLGGLLNTRFFLCLGLAMYRMAGLFPLNIDFFFSVPASFSPGAFFFSLSSTVGRRPFVRLLDLPIIFPPHYHPGSLLTPYVWFDFGADIRNDTQAITSHAVPVRTLFRAILPDTRSLINLPLCLFLRNSLPCPVFCLDCLLLKTLFFRTEGRPFFPFHVCKILFFENFFPSFPALLPRGRYFHRDALVVFRVVSLIRTIDGFFSFAVRLVATCRVHIYLSFSSTVDAIYFWNRESYLFS